MTHFSEFGHSFFVYNTAVLPHSVALAREPYQFVWDHSVHEMIAVA